MTSDRQLDLLGGSGGPERVPTRPEPLAVRWVSSDAPGRLGRAAWPGVGGSLSGDLEHLRDHHRTTVLLAAGDDPKELLETARALGIDVRHLASLDDRAMLERQSIALANDLRAGRRAIVISRDAENSAVPIGVALLKHGEGIDAVIAALGETSANERERIAAMSNAHADHEPSVEPTRAETTHTNAPEKDEPPTEPTRAKKSQTKAHPVDAPAIEPPRHDLDRVARNPRSSRLAGAVLGAAIGDAMGHPTEFIRSFEEIRAEYGPDGVTGYVLFGESGGRRFAPYTDDTQMAECVLRSLLKRDRDLDATMRDLAARFVSWANDPQGGHRAPGNACLQGCKALERGALWHEAGGEKAGGCGSVMRAYPFGIFFADDLGRAESWSVAHSKLTHRDPIALAASAAMAIGMARVIKDDPLEVVLSEMVAAACRYSAQTAAMMAVAIDEAQRGFAPEVTLQRLQGWAAHEAIAAAVYVFARHPDDPRAAILEGANTPGDSDSIATLAGALVGARCGVGALPADWIRDLERADDLLDLALSI